MGKDYEAKRQLKSGTKTSGENEGRPGRGFERVGTRIFFLCASPILCTPLSECLDRANPTNIQDSTKQITLLTQWDPLFQFVPDAQTVEKGDENPPAHPPLSALTIYSSALLCSLYAITRLPLLILKTSQYPGGNATGFFRYWNVLTGEATKIINKCSMATMCSIQLFNPITCNLTQLTTSRPQYIVFKFNLIMLIAMPRGHKQTRINE